jgi:hypothetical protein
MSRVSPCSPISWCDLFTAEWLTAIGTVGATFAAVALGAKDWILGKFVHPKLNLDGSIASPSAQKMLFRTETGQALGDVWYFRLKISNSGNAVARDVHVFLASVEEWENEGKEFVPVKRFLPMFLKWSNVGATTTPTLWPDMPRYCDWFHVSTPEIKQFVGEELSGTHLQSVLALDLEVTPNNSGSLLGRGTYRCTLKLAAANHKPITKMFRIEFGGLWYPDENGMFRQIKVIPL